MINTNKTRRWLCVCETYITLVYITSKSESTELPLMYYSFSNNEVVRNIIKIISRRLKSSCSRGRTFTSFPIISEILPSHVALMAL